ncbi:hypothetical protein GCM10028787_06960 [Brachybacterium horti]
MHEDLSQAADPPRLVGFFVPPVEVEGAVRQGRTMTSFSIGDGVRVKDGPLQHQYGVVVYIREDDGTYLVRFGAAQQLYYRPEEIEPWQ